MARTPSNMIALGSPMPRFSLPDVVSDQIMDDAHFARARAMVVMFICNHCPYVVHIRDGMVATAQDLVAQGVAVVAINSNDVEKYPADHPQKMLEDARAYGYPFPYLFDESQNVAKAFQAACTPDFYVFDAQRRLTYRGQFDESRPGNGKPVTGTDLRQAALQTLRGETVNSHQMPSIGCNIKWK